MMNDLNDSTKTVFVIPFSEPDEDSTDDVPTMGMGDIQWRAYRAAWNKCLDRIQSIFRENYTQRICDAVQAVNDAYLVILPGLPRPELPVVAISNPSASASLLGELIAQLSVNNDEFETLIELHPGDCLTLVAAMTALVTKFVNSSPSWRKSKRKTAFADYDIELLDAWYSTLPLNDSETSRNLVVILHDFEQFDASILEDLFFIASSRIRNMPIVFVLSLASPQPGSSFLNQVLSRRSLSLFRVHYFRFSSGPEFLEDVIVRTFFDPTFEPDVMIGPATLDYLHAYFTKHSPSLDSILKVLQVAHLKHFSAVPLSFLAQNPVPDDPSSFPGTFKLLDHLLQRVQSDSGSSKSKRHDDWDSLSSAVEKSRSAVRLKLQSFRLGFMITQMINTLVTSSRDPTRPPQPNGSQRLKFLLAGTGTYHLEISKILRTLSHAELLSLIEELVAYVQTIPSDVCEASQQLELAGYVDSLREDDDATEGVVNGLTVWLKKCFTTFPSVLKTPLWEVWYMGSSPFPEEVLNPSIRATVLAGLLKPHAFSSDSSDDEVPLYELPDSSILFHRYLDSGKVVNAFDLFESFKIVLESQQQTQGTKQTPSRRKSAKNPLDSEEWRAQVQARFIRALHELDHLGFVKHAARKTDHITRTIFDPTD